jgi:hypothetical protein
MAATNILVPQGAATAVSLGASPDPAGSDRGYDAVRSASGL